MKTNVKRPDVVNHEEVTTSQLSPIEQLRRTVMACLLWEDGFYESGEGVAARIKRLVPQCDPAKVAALAIKARTTGKLRHVPLLLVRELVRTPRGVPIADLICNVVLRADELAEFLSLYWSEGKCPLSKQVKKGLACAFTKFNEYALAKYNRDATVKLRDVLFMVHAKPVDEAQAALWKRLINGDLAPPDTWEVALSAGADKKAAFERLLRDSKLGYMALLRNLRNMQQAGVDESLVFSALESGASTSKALPFRYVSAARAVPQWEQQIDGAMQAALGGMEKLPGSTVVLVDTSPSMNYQLSSKSDLTRRDAAGALAVLLRGICERVRVFAFSSEMGEVPPRNGMALMDAILQRVPSNGTLLGRAIATAATAAPDADRMIVFTDEESQDPVGNPHCKGYMINVATSENGVGYGDWTHINGFSESVVEFIREAESTAP